MDNDQILRQHLLTLLEGRGAHLPFDDAVGDFPADKMNALPPRTAYSPWHLVEHLRIAQWDILEYIRNPQYEAPAWPEDYWPPREAQTDEAGWAESVRAFRDDLAQLKAIVADPQVNLYQPIPHGYNGHTILREMLIVADHNAYHIGELGILRQILDAWGQRTS